MGNTNPKMTFEIDYFSQRNSPIQSDVFRSGSCNWSVTVYPKGDGINSETMILYLEAAGSPRPWRREVRFRFVVVNQSNFHKSKTFVRMCVFNSTNRRWGAKTDFHFSELLKENFLVNDKLKIQVFVAVLSSSGWPDPYVLSEKKNETVSINGFNILPSQLKSANFILETYPETVLYIQPQDPRIRSAYMNVLLSIYETLYNSPLENLTEAELSNVSKGLLDLTQAGFKLEWLRTKLDRISAERKKRSDCKAQVEDLGELMKIAEGMMSKLKATYTLN